jgi:monofunctional biosynthetic peptidoglycan transglycosylase
MKRRSFVLRAALAVAAFVFGMPVLLLLLFRVVPPPGSAVMLWARASGPVEQHWVPLRSISPNLVRAVIASEDGKFCSHAGFDWPAIRAAFAHDVFHKPLRGGSTISQQTAKNLFLTLDRTWLRKGAEAYVTFWMENLWPKRRIMETYLNIVQWGPRQFGAETAARAYFHTSAARLSAREAATLAAIIPAPARYRADRPGPFVKKQAAIITARMAEVKRDGLDACVLASGG